LQESDATFNPSFCLIIETRLKVNCQVSFYPHVKPCDNISLLKEEKESSEIVALYLQAIFTFIALQT
jgi:hypothetical protein